MAVVELLLPALPAHVRTARLVVVAAARRAGLSDALLDELRLAVGEACARAVGLHAQHTLEERVAVRITDDATGLAVAVVDFGPAAGPKVDDVTGGLVDPVTTAVHPVGADAVDQDLADPDVALALLSGLVDDIDVSTADSGGTTVTMRWPLPVRVPGGPAPTAATPL